MFCWLVHEDLVIDWLLDCELPFLNTERNGKKQGITEASIKQRRAAIPTHQALCGIPNNNSSQTDKQNGIQHKHQK